MHAASWCALTGYEEFHQQAYPLSPALWVAVEGHSWRNSCWTWGSQNDTCHFGCHKGSWEGDGIWSAKWKVELWRYNANLVFKAGECIVCLLCLVSIHSLTLPRNRVWTCSTKINHSSTPTSSYNSLRLVSDGMGGWNFSACCLMTTASPHTSASSSQLTLTGSLIVIVTRPKEKDSITKD